MTFGSLFSGIGGMDLGLERAGMMCKWQVEINEYCRRILDRHWPDVPKFGDVAEFPSADSHSRDCKCWSEKQERQEDWRTVAGCDCWIRCDIIAGGFPCQPVSVAGRREAQRDPRWLWPHFARIVRVLRPGVVIVENVPGLLVHGGVDVLGDLAEMGFDAEWATLPASAFGAPHLRERVFIVAYAIGESAERERRGTCGQERQSTGTLESNVVRQKNGKAGTERIATSAASSANSEIISKRKQTKKKNTVTDSGKTWRVFGGDSFRDLPFQCWGSDQPGVDRTLDGVPHRMERIAGLGNAVVPQVAEWIGRRIMEANNP